MPRCEILLSYRRYIQNTFYTFSMCLYSMCLYNDTAILKLHEGNRKVYKVGLNGGSSYV